MRLIQLSKTLAVNPEAIEGIEVGKGKLMKEVRGTLNFLLRG